MQAVNLIEAGALLIQALIHLVRERVMVKVHSVHQWCAVAQKLEHSGLNNYKVLLN